MAGSFGEFLEDLQGTRHLFVDEDEVLHGRSRLQVVGRKCVTKGTQGFLKLPAEVRYLLGRLF